MSIATSLDVTPPAHYRAIAALEKRGGLIGLNAGDQRRPHALQTGGGPSRRSCSTRAAITASETVPTMAVRPASRAIPPLQSRQAR